MPPSYKVHPLATAVARVPPVMVIVAPVMPAPVRVGVVVQQRAVVDVQRVDVLPVDGLPPSTPLLVPMPWELPWRRAG